MDFATARKHMVDSQVRPNDVPNLTLQRAMETLPREEFVPTNKKHLAYAEMDIPLFEGRWLMRARDFSKLVHELQVDEQHLVLDVGCGFGYSTAVLARMASMVLAIEDNEAACQKVEARLSALSIDNAAVIECPLPDGMPGQGPYDRILINGAVEAVPPALLQQLADGGRLAAIIVRGDVAEATIFIRSGDTFGDVVRFEAAHKDLVPGFTRPKEFVF